MNLNSEEKSIPNIVRSLPHTELRQLAERANDIAVETVCTPSRMLQSEVADKANINETTYKLAFNGFDFSNKIATKGKQQMKMYSAGRQTESSVFEKTKEFILNKLESELSDDLNYHNINHTLDVYRISTKLAKSEGISEEDTMLLKTASLFHDAGFILKAEGHEKISCAIVDRHLPDFGYSNEQIAKIKGMIMATKIPQCPKNHLEQILADADLDYLGRTDFEEISERLFQELGIKNRNDWNKIQINFFESHSYFTASAKNSRNDKKHENLEKIKNQTHF